MIQLNINNKKVKVEAPAEMPLLWVLRDLLALTGTKYGCGIGQCGACTVHLDGKAVRSCITAISAVTGKKITTIEGLSNDDQLHPVQEAWIEEDVSQCGYCQSGQMMSAAALLKNNPNPNEEDIEQAMNGNLCRCGTYLRIKQAVKRAGALNR